MLPLPLESLSAETLATCLAGATESQTLEFKRELPPGQGRNEEFAKDVAAMANTDGGDIVIGVPDPADTGGVPNVVGLPNLDFDEFGLRLTSVLETHLQRRLVGLRLHHVPFAEGSGVVVVRVPASFDGPHAVAVPGKQSLRFVYRNGTKVTDMNYDQVQGAFDRTATLVAKAQAWLDERMPAKGRPHEPHHPVQTSDWVMLCVVPLAGLAKRWSLHVAGIDREQIELLYARQWPHHDRRLNVEGLLVSGRWPGPLFRGYAQLWRDGRFETVCPLDALPSQVSRTTLSGGMVGTFLRDQLRAYLQIARQHGLSGPALLRVGLWNPNRWTMTPSARDPFAATGTPAPTRVALPDDFLQEASIGTAEKLLKPQLEILWQAFDYPRCFLYDESGAWIK